MYYVKANGAASVLSSVPGGMCASKRKTKRETTLSERDTLGTGEVPVSLVAVDQCGQPATGLNPSAAQARLKLNCNLQDYQYGGT